MTNVTKKQRKKIPKTLEKRLFQEANSTCSFCAETEVATLEAHHIDNNPANNVLENLLLVCGSCHKKLTFGVYSEADAILKKRQIAWAYNEKSTHEAGRNINFHNSTIKGDVAQNITKITTKRAPKISHPPGSVGADLKKKGYIDYLLRKYFECREADKSYGKSRPFSYSEIHSTVQKKFGNKTFFMPVEYFEELVSFLCGRIDNTILGRNILSRGKRIYHSYAEHLELQAHLGNV